MRKMGWMLGLLLCSGCVTTELQYKEGITPLQRNRDVEACTRQATKRAPVASVSHTSQRYWVPARQHCNSKGCYWQGGYWAGGQTTVTDQNISARKRAYGQCMAQRGYQPIATQGCTGKVREAVMRTPQGRYPRLTAESCTVGMSDGTLKVYTP
ncbi:hypothetical protein [Phaeobacter inhibens]|uniref:hypothetical protein n=1 Tax=Phaeobacter inhibens TaxID=221822 RepID=UPI000B2425AF|nr:hypothetical protein [Phaeobacter inhibens]WHP67309.1 hypothetical protein QMZ01_12235 [Phaeobacter inhibens]